MMPTWIVACACIDLATAVARVDERAQTDAAEGPGLARGDVAEQMRDHALRQVVGLDLAGHRQRLQFRHQPPVPSDHPLDEPGVAEVIQSAFAPVALPGGIDQRQPPG
jgi:hypothetical protein